MNNTPILDVPWPPDLDPATVLFHQRTVTILRRLGFFDDPALLNDVIEADALGW